MLRIRKDGYDLAVDDLRRLERFIGKMDSRAARLGFMSMETIDMQKRHNARVLENLYNEIGQMIDNAKKKLC